MPPMISKLIRCLVAALVLYLLYICAGLLVTAIAAPAITLTIIAVILILCLAGFDSRPYLQGPRTRPNRRLRIIRAGNDFASTGAIAYVPHKDGSRDVFNPETRKWVKIAANQSEAPSRALQSVETSSLATD